MSTTQITLLALAAVLLFWAVGAYNRLILLRNAVARSFVALAVQIGRRNELLEQWVTQLAPQESATTDRLDALRGAIGQTRSACDHARGRPCVASAVASVALAEAVLAEARERVDGTLQVHAQAGAETTTSALTAELGATDLALVFARERFNGAVKHYNRAVGQFPTHLICPIFGFQPTGSL
jgi:LemA protein